MQVTSPVRKPLITGGKTVHDVTEDICRQVEAKPSKLWLMAFGVSVVTLAIGFLAVAATLWEGHWHVGSK